MKKIRVPLPPVLITLLNVVYAVARNRQCAHRIIKFHVELFKYWKFIS